ncbi:AAA family ATPase [Nocardioides dongkuii]|uniref:AAA family ATPase n=1 Tax=Nocardioides dongkuii TaxID=2760089 RepID=UPI0015F9E712|nr:AAA family ATPase [Nocardioides dongkuii]
MPPLPSPYTPGEAPPVLVGRGAQLTDAQADLALLATYGRFLGRIRVHVGSRGVGKTSLLKAVRDEAGRAGAVVAWVTARGDESLVAALVAALVRALDDIGVDVGRRTALRDRLTSLTLELGAGGTKAGVELDVSPAAAPGTGAASAAFGDFVALAAAAARERGSAGLCLLVDEVQAAPREDLRTLAYAWQELQQATPEPSAVVIAAGLPNSPDVLTAAVTFSERFAFRTLERLDDADAAEVLEAPARDHEVSWHPDLLAEVIALAQGYPYFLQLFGDAVWREAGPPAGTVLGTDLLARTRSRVDAELATMFRARWGKASPGEQRVLGAMAELTGPAEDDVRRGEIAEHLGVSSNDLGVPRRSLLDKGLIEVAGRGSLRFTVPGFAAWVRQETGG